MTSEPYRDPAASVDERVADLLGRMTLEEKVAQLGAIWVNQLVRKNAFDHTVARELLADGIGQITRIGSSTGLLPDDSASLINDIQHVAVEQTRLGIPVLLHEEGVGGFTHRGATTFPQALGLACTWDPALVGEVADVIRHQMLAVGARLVLSPVLDVARDPAGDGSKRRTASRPSSARASGRVRAGTPDLRSLPRRGLRGQALPRLRDIDGRPEPGAGPPR